MTKVLKLKFKNSEGKVNTISIKNAKENLDEATVKAAMQKIVDAKAFIEEEVNLYETIVGAEYYTTQSDSIFAANAQAAN